MATKNTTKTKAAPAVKKEIEAEFKYGVNDLADALDIEPASARVALRKAGIEKAGRSYGWNTQKELDEVVKKLKAGAPAAEKPKAKVKAAGTETAKPGAKAKVEAAPVAKVKVKKVA